MLFLLFFLSAGWQWVRVVCASPSTHSTRHHTHLPAATHAAPAPPFHNPEGLQQGPPPWPGSPSQRQWPWPGGGLDQCGGEPAQIPERNSGAMGKAWEKLEFGLRVGWGETLRAKAPSTGARLQLLRGDPEALAPSAPAWRRAHSGEQPLSGEVQIARSWSGPAALFAPGLSRLPALRGLWNVVPPTL